MSGFKEDDDGLRREETHESVLERVRSAGLLTVSPEMFEKLYLNPKTSVKGDLRSTFGNPTPLGLVGFVVALMPLSCTLMGWRNTNIGPNSGAANIGAYFLIGGPFLLISGLLEFFLGNTFTFVVFISYAGIFFALAASFQPFYNAAGAYSETGLDNASGSLTPGFNSSFAFFLIACACLNVLFVICATRVNIVFMLIFFGAGLGLVLAAAARWRIAEGALVTAGRLVIISLLPVKLKPANDQSFQCSFADQRLLYQGTGASWFAICMLGWYLIAIQLFATMGIPVPFPVGDLSQTWGKRRKSKGAHSA